MSETPVDPIAGLDVVYLVRGGESNDELHYSLRSLVNLVDHARVWFVGYRPRWVRNVEHIPGNRHADKPRNVFDNVRIACRDDRLTENIVVMNDDFYVTQPLAEIPNWYRGALADHLGSIKRQSEWRTSLVNTLAWLKSNGCPDPLSYELHKPIVINRARMAEALGACARYRPRIPCQWRTVYGNRCAIGGEANPRDGKIRRGRNVPDGLPFLSSDDGDWRSGSLAEKVRDMFPDPCAYEKPVGK